MQSHSFDKLEEWLEARKTITGIPISSTDAPAIVGVSRFKSAFQLYHEKRNATADVGPQYAEMARWGRELEDLIAARYAINTGRQIERTGGGKFTIQQGDPEWMIASCDRYAIVREVTDPTTVVAVDGEEVDDEDQAERTVLAPVGVKIVLELKNAHFMTKARWESEVEPPLEYLVQLQHQLAVTGLPWGSLAALIGGVEFRWADVKRNEGFIEGLMRAEAEFRERVERGDPPEADGSPATSRILKELYPDDAGTTIELPPEALDWSHELEKAKAEEKEAAGRKAEFSNKIKAAIGENTMGVLRDGTAYTYKKQSRKEVVQAATSFRVLRKKG